MIKIIDKNDVLTIRCPTSEFIFGMTYCEYKIPFYIEGKEPPKHKESEIRKAVGSIHHAKEEKKEKYSGRVKPITSEELRQALPDKQNNIEFIRERIFSRLYYPTKIDDKNIQLILTGRPDKILRQDECLIVEEDKFPTNPFIYIGKMNPFNSQKLQVLVYLNSQFSIMRKPVHLRDYKVLNGKYGDPIDPGQSTIDTCFNIETVVDNYNPENWFDIACQKKKWIINIRRTENNENNIVKKFEGLQSDEDKTYLDDKLLRFTGIILDKREKIHHNNFKKCIPCEYATVCKFSLKTG